MNWRYLEKHHNFFAWFLDWKIKLSNTKLAWDKKSFELLYSFFLIWWYQRSYNTRSTYLGGLTFAFLYNPWGNLRAQTIMALQKCYKIRKKSFFFSFRKNARYTSRWVQIASWASPVAQKSLKYSKSVIWKFYSFWKFDFFEGSEAIFEFWRISLKIS